MLKNVLKLVTDGKNLSEIQASEVIKFIANEKPSPILIGGFLSALRAKKETINEITGFAKGMRELADNINCSEIVPLVDSCGTGGDGSNTFNISTASAILVSSMDVCVAKHSNYSQTSKCGSSNVLQALGIPLLQTAKDVKESLVRHNIAFIHAPYFHKATANVANVRKELGIRTIFNYLGPLTNPAYPTGQVIGVSNPDMLYTMARVLSNLECERALIVCGSNPIMDEISVCGKTIICELNNSKIKDYTIEPKDFGLAAANISEIQGHTPEYNATLIEEIFKGNITDAKLNAVLLNSAALLWVAKKTESIKEGIEQVKNCINSGKAFDKLQELSTKNNC